MKKETKITIIVFVLLIAIAVPAYFYMRQNAGPEGIIQVKGAVNNPANVTFSELKAFTPLNVTVTVSSSSHPEDSGVFNYKGASLRSLLEQAHAFENATSVFVQAADGYGTTLPLQEVMQNEKIILAYEKDGASIKSLTEGGEGPIRLIIATDQFAQRWIRDVAAIEVS
jgi:DMSO/TMAO reductase YedYZ molybdopterin-dependent catalytic subunit